MEFWPTALEDVEMRKPFWQSKRVLVTGHTGFKGSWLCLWLQQLGAEVHGYAFPPPTRPSLFEIARVADGMACTTGDIRDLEHLKETVVRSRPEIIFHLAAQPLVHESYKNPVETYTTNVIGTVNVLEAVRAYQEVRAVVCVTSDKCYANNEWVWGYRENERLGGKDPYSSSKAAAELVISAYRSSYFAPAHYHKHGTAVASGRAGNVIGGGDWAKHRLVPDIVSALCTKAPVVVRNPAAVRPWQHVLNPLDGYVTLAEKMCTDGQVFAQSWNFGPEDEDVKPVSWIVEYLTKIWGEAIGWKLEEAPSGSEDLYLKLDCSKAKKLLGWMPVVNLTTALEWIAEWYGALAEGENMRYRTEAQIRRYEKLVSR